MRSSQGDELVIRLTAPLNFDYNQIETGSVIVLSGQGDRERVTVTENSANSSTFTGRIKLRPDQPVTIGDNQIQYISGTTLKISHGFGYLGRHATIKPN